MAYHMNKQGVVHLDKHSRNIVMPELYDYFRTHPDSKYHTVSGIVNLALKRLLADTQTPDSAE